MKILGTGGTGNVVEAAIRELTRIPYLGHDNTQRKEVDDV